MIFYIIVGIVVLILLLILLISLLKKRSENKKLMQYFHDEYLKILKIDALDKAIVSPTDLKNLKAGPKKILVKVHETSELTDKTYLLDMEKPWFFGRKPAPNTICIRGDKTVSSVHCSLQASNDGVALLDMGAKNGTFFSPRKNSKQTYQLQHNSYQPLTTGDRFFVGFTCFEVTIFNSNYGII